jgi:hypothetical protein
MVEVPVHIFALELLGVWIFYHVVPAIARGFLTRKPERTLSGANSDESRVGIQFEDENEDD